MKKAKFFFKDVIPIIVSLISIYFLINYFNNSIIYYIGLILNLIGLILWWSGKIELGDNWNYGYGKPHVNKLVTTGIYSKIRHPIYLGIIFTWTGLCLIHLSMAIIFIWVITLFYFVWRIYLENKYLNKKNEN